METGLLCAKNIISLPTVLCIEMKNATITVWLDQETEDKVAVGLDKVAVGLTTIAQEKFLYTCIVLSQISAILNCCMC